MLTRVGMQQCLGLKFTDGSVGEASCKLQHIFRIDILQNGAMLLAGTLVGWNDLFALEWCDIHFGCTNIGSASKTLGGLALAGMDINFFFHTSSVRQETIILISPIENPHVLNFYFGRPRNAWIYCSFTSFVLGGN